jgi:hypothetical protein
MAALRRLNSNIWLDDSDRFKVFGGNENRAAVGYKDKDIATIERNDIPEFDQYGGGHIEWIPCDPAKALANRFKAMTQQAMVGHDEPQLMADIEAMMGDRQVEEIVLGRRRVMAERVEGVCVDGETRDAILLRLYYLPVKGPTRRIKIGWRSFLKRMLSCGIPGVTREALERELGVSLALQRTAEKTPKEIMTGAVK